MKKYNYVYRIIHLNPQDQRKYYIGVRSCDCLPMDDINYWSSSKSLKEAINKQGKENFVKEILSMWDTRDDALKEEVRLHSVLNVSMNNDYYNIVKQTSTKFDTGGLFGEDNPLFGFKHSDKFSKDISIRQKGENNSFYGKHHTDESKEKIRKKTLGENNHFYGKKHTEKTLKLIREKSSRGAKGKKYISNTKLKLVKRVLPNELVEYLNSGWVLGRIKFI